MSPKEPTRILEPKPPEDDGHRKPIMATPKADRPKPDTLSTDRLRNCRRVTPRVSGSGGTQGATVVVPAVATAVDACRRSRATDRSMSRPETSASSPFARLPAEDRSRL